MFHVTLPETVVLRLVSQRLYTCVGGYGPLVGTASEAADLLLSHRQARIPAAWEEVVRLVLVLRARQAEESGVE